MFVPINFIKNNDPKTLNFLKQPQSVRELKKYIYILTDRPYLFDKSIVDACDGIICDLSHLPSINISECAFYVYFSRGDFALPHIKKIIKEGGAFISPDLPIRVQWWENNKYCIEIYNQIAYLLQYQPKGSIAEFGAIMQAINATRNIDGDYVEIGVFSGSSALAALLYMRRMGIKRKCYLLDTYGGFNYEESKVSQDIKWYGSHKSWIGGQTGNDAMERIRRLTQNTGNEVIVERFNACADELPKNIEHIAMANVDIDIYEAVRDILIKLELRLRVGGIITIEDPTCTPTVIGSYYALYEFLESEIGQKFICLCSDTTYFLIKMRE